MTRSSLRCVSSFSSCPAVCGRIILPAGVEVTLSVNVPTSPNDHFTAGPDCGVCISGNRCAGGTSDCPGVRLGIISAAGVQVIESVPTAPDDHFAASPGCSMPLARRRHVDGAGSRPVVRARIVSSTSVKLAGVLILPTPDDHLTASPHRSMPSSS